MVCYNLSLSKPLIYASSCCLSPEISPCDLALLVPAPVLVALVLGLANHILFNQLVDFIILKSGLGQFGAAMLAKCWRWHAQALKIVFHNWKRLMHRHFAHCSISCGYINSAFDKMWVIGIVGNVIDWRGGNALRFKNGQNLLSASRSDPAANHPVDLSLMLYPRCIGDKFWIINHARCTNSCKKPFSC